MTPPVTKRPLIDPAVRSRWISVLLAGIIPVPGVLLVLFWYRTSLDAFVASPWWMVAAIVFLSCASMLWLGRVRFVAFLGVRHFASYPPLWVGGIAGGSLVSVLLAHVPALQESFGISPPLPPCLDIVGRDGLCGTALIAFGSLALLARRRAMSTANTSLPALARPDAPHLTSFEVLREWLRSDEPVESANHDAFDYRRIARRIATRILRERPPTQAVVGALGAGKTTLRKLVAADLQTAVPAGRVDLVPVELWPYETTRAAVQGVIGALIDALALRVSVVALRGIPGAYAEVITASGGIGAAFVRVQGLPSSPLALLRRIDEIATAIDMRYVVWIEDLERFAGTHAATVPGAETAEEAERLAPIRALLAGLDQLRSVTVITATTSLDTRFDLDKIAQYIERLPELSEGDVVPLLEGFREGCRGAVTIIDPTPVNDRTRIKFADPAAAAMRRAILGTRLGGIGDVLPALVSTPRTLKQGLRLCLEIWEKLAGEVDFDDILVMSLLRVACPNVFSLIERHIHSLRGHLSASDTAAKAARDEWSRDLNATVEDERLRAVISKVIEFVFGEAGRSEKTQGLGRRGHADYWRRFLDLADITEQEQDQPILRVMIGEDESALLDLVMDPERSAAVENFARLLSTARVQNLLAPLVDRLAARSATTWNTTGDTFSDKPPGLIPVWRMWLDRARRGEISSETVLEAVKQAYEVSMPTNLDLVDEIEHWFVTGGGDDIDFFRDDADRREEAKRHQRQALLSVHAEKPAVLASALRGAAPAVLLRLSWGPERVRAKDYAGLPFEGWGTLAATILEAASTHPRDLLPQIACLVCRESTVIRDNIVHKYDFDPELASRLFGSSEPVLDAFTGWSDEFPDDPRVRELAFIAADRTKVPPAN